MADVRFLKLDVLITQPYTELWKFGVGIDLNIVKRVLSLKPKPGVDFQLSCRNFRNQYDVITLP